MILPKLLDLPMRFSAATLHGLPDGPLATVVRAYLTANPKEVAPGFFGRARTYKSYAAALIARERHARGDNVLWYNAVHGGAALERARYDNKTARRLQDLRTYDLVVVDEFYGVKPDTYQAQIVVEVCLARWDAQLPTVWTGNVPVHQDPWAPFGVFGTAFQRRIEESTKGYAVFIK